MYQKAVIYKICCNDINIKEIYVGSTCNLTRRKSGHKTTCKSEKNKDRNLSVYQFIRKNGGFDNWSIVMIEKYPCENKIELEARERYWIEKLEATLNKNIPTRTLKEYYIDNREKFKEYYTDNKEKIDERNKKYREKNKEKISEHIKEKYTCICGSTIRRHEKNRHEKTQKHINFIESQKE